MTMHYKHWPSVEGGGATSSAAGGRAIRLGTCWLVLFTVVSSISATAPKTAGQSSWITPWDAPSEARWTEWGQWSPCVGSPCEQSVRNRKRHCHSESEMGGTCEGPSIAYELCLFNLRCRRSRIADQCRGHDTEEVRYLPASSDEYSHCGQLECQEEHRGGNSTDTESGQFIRMMEKVTDGAPCALDRQCLNGQCQSVNCSFNRTAILHSCVGANNTNLCTVLCGTTPPSAGDDGKAITIPACASNITIRTAKLAPANINIQLGNGEFLDPGYADTVQVSMTAADVVIVYSKSARSLAASDTVGDAHFDQVTIQEPLRQNLSIYDEFGDLGQLEYNYALGDACDIPMPLRVEEERDEEEKGFASDLIFQPYFNQPPEVDPLDEQVREVQSGTRQVNNDDTPFKGQESMVNQQLRWIFLPFTQCSRSCGGGTKRSSVICGSPQMQVFPSGYCSSSVRKPKDIISPCNERPCPARWVKGQWTCSSSCRTNGTGVRTRSVSCRQVQMNGVDTAVNQKFCLAKIPRSTAACQADLCRTSWIKGRWSKCNATCGPGTKSRRVYCAVGSQRVNASLCSHMQRPKLMKNCNRRDCVMWQGGEWSVCNNQCANGFRFRPLVCMEVPRGRGYSPRVRSDSECNHLPKPRTMESCGSDLEHCPITYRWHTANWRKCTSKCGGKGVRYREVHCSTDRRTNSSLGVVKYTTVDPVYCNRTGPQPASMQECNRRVRCPGKWHRGDWSTCSITCGHGKQTRAVVCKRPNSAGTLEVTRDSDCDTAKRKKPSAMQTCLSVPCPGGSQCTGDDSHYMSACAWAHERNICHIDYFQRHCCATCNGAA